MLPRAISISLLLVFAACVALSGCSTGQSRVWIDEKISFSAYTVFEVQPVFNATNGPLTEGIPATLTALIMEQLKNKKFLIANSSQIYNGVLIIKSSIIVYNGCQIFKGTATPGFVLGSPPTGQSMCTLQTQLVDKSTNRVLAEIYTTKVVGGCYTTQYKGQWLLEEAATDVVNEVNKIMKSDK